MKKIIVPLAVSCWVLPWCLPDALIAQDKLDMQETITGQGFQAIEAAIPEIKRIMPDITDYIITVTRSGSELVVLFQNPKDVAPNRVHLGCEGPKPCVAVWLRASDLKVLRMNLEK
jgi:hypothetical protein